MEYKNILMRDLCDNIMQNHASIMKDTTIEAEIVAFRNELPPEMRIRFNHLLDRINNDDSEFAYAAFEQGILFARQ
ncbi:MAG: hypothetical protein PUC12_01225 [Clostridiales bacterium]|nr:hypothetical protein [Clostridiales bacterium]